MAWYFFSQDPSKLGFVPQGDGTFVYTPSPGWPTNPFDTTNQPFTDGPNGIPIPNPNYVPPGQETGQGASSQIGDTGGGLQTSTSSSMAPANSEQPIIGMRPDNTGTWTPNTETNEHLFTGGRVGGGIDLPGGGNIPGKSDPGMGFSGSFSTDTNPVEATGKVEVPGFGDMATPGITPGPANTMFGFKRIKPQVPGLGGIA